MEKQMKSAETKGDNKIIKDPPQSITSKGHPVKSKKKSISPLDVFKLSIKRAENLLEIHKISHGKQQKPPKILIDLHRASIVMAISALDAFIRAFLLEQIIAILVDSKKSVPKKLADRIQSYLKDSLFDAARNNDLLERTEQAFQNDFEKKSFQGTKVISENLEIIGIENVFQKIARAAKKNEEELKANLDEYTKRRHIIAHSGDYDLKQIPPQENQITKKYVETCLKTVATVATEIARLAK